MFFSTRNTLDWRRVGFYYEVTALPQTLIEICKMNQWIKIHHKLYYTYDWILVFYIVNKEHREKAPSDVRSSGYWDWHLKEQIQKEGQNFNWEKS